MFQYYKIFRNRSVTILINCGPPYTLFLNLFIMTRFGLGPIRLMAETREAASNIYQFKARDIDGKEIDFSRHNINKVWNRDQ